MKKLLIILFMGSILAACGDSRSRTSDVNEDQNMEENSNEVISPDVESDSLGTMNVDTLSSNTQDSIR